MNMISLIIVGVLVLITLVALAQPFVLQRNANRRDTGSSQIQRDELLTDYERVLATIRDLDEDHQTGKLGEEAYQRERAYWTEQGIVLLQQLEPDSEPEVDIAPKPVTEVDKVLDDAIEQAIAAYRQAEAKS